MAVQIRQSGIRRLVNDPVALWTRRLAQDVRDDAQQRAPVGLTGDLKRSITAGVPIVRGLTVRCVISTRTGYGLFPEAGTGIYGPTGRPITPRRAPFLVFQPRGLDHVIRVRSVKGQPGQHFMRDALLAVVAAL